MGEKATNAVRLARALKKNGVTHMFGQSNPPAITLACMKEGIHQVPYRQENTGSYMAHGFAVTRGTVGVVTAQNGPASTLIVPGLAECKKAGHPVVAIVQEIPVERKQKNAFQELEHEKMYDPVAKWVGTIPSESRIEDFVDMAFVAATSGKPGPAVLLCPDNLFFDTAEYPVPGTRTAHLGKYPIDRFTADYKMIEAAAKKLAEAENPIIYAGGGVISSGGQEELRAIQEKYAIPVATTTMGKGSVDEKHPLSMGPIGYYMGTRGYSKFMRPMVENADVIMLIGNRTNQNGTDVWTLLPKNAEYIHIDIDPMEIGRNYESMRLLGDAKYTLKALDEALGALDVSKRLGKRGELENTIKRALEEHQKEVDAVVGQNICPIRVEDIVCEADKQMKDDHIVVADASFSSVWVANYVAATNERKFIFPRGLAGIGWGVGMAIGAAVAAPDRSVFCLTGDGGFAHDWSEMEVAKREGLSLVVAVINNECLSYQAWGEEAVLGAHTNACDLGPVDHAKIAEACGWTGITVRKPEELPGAFEKAFASDGCVLIDVMTQPRCVGPVPFIEPEDALVRK